MQATRSIRPDAPSRSSWLRALWRPGQDPAAVLADWALVALVAVASLVAVTGVIG